MALVSIKSFGKLNLFLHILSERSDGYHDIFTLFSAITLHDLITLERSPETVIICNDKSVPLGDDNLIMKADRLLRQTASYPQYRITLEKNIPIGAGLGGGSGNACAYLKLVNKENRLGLRDGDFGRILNAIGSDTSFFLKLGAQIGEGRGEVLKQADLDELDIVVVHPNFPIYTKDIYASEKLMLTDPSKLPNMRIQLGAAEISGLMFNALENAADALYPEIGVLKAALLKAGALSAVMTGSGSAVFGLFKDENLADKGFWEIKERFPSYRVWRVKTPVKAGSEFEPE
jgi:4-diphosphocytidyl-2-C-methyl-D-erythritol kinase